MNTSYKEIVAQDRRLAMLRFLEQDSDYKINDSVMQQALEQLGHSVSREAIRADFDFLAEIGLIDVETYFDGKVQVAKSRGAGWTLRRDAPLSRALNAQDRSNQMGRRSSIDRLPAAFATKSAHCDRKGERLTRLWQSSTN